MWSAPLRFVQRFLPTGVNRKTRCSSTSYKPAPIRSRVHQYKKRLSRASPSPSTSSQSSFYSSASSGSTSSSDSDVAPEVEMGPPPPSFEPPTGDFAVAFAREGDFARFEFAKLQLGGRDCASPGSGISPAPSTPFTLPGAKIWLAAQRKRDDASIRHYPTSAPPIFYTNLPVQPVPPPPPPPAPARPLVRQSSYAMKHWRALQQKVEAVQQDQQALAHIRGTDVPTARWATYNKKWLRALDASDAPPLAFTDIPWPIMHIPHAPSHITPEEVHQFVLCAEPTAVDQAGVLRLTAEIKRWHPDKFNVAVLPLVVELARPAVAEAAALVLRILLQARDDIKQNPAPL
ncbi:hypothetical protein DFH09DRAFT_209562 [Mycena vulgaris]|nr:hypothetical protein DFH09DRAFT_209562 [Mycena vulgaris]